MPSGLEWKEPPSGKADEHESKYKMVFDQQSSQTKRPKESSTHSERGREEDVSSDYKRRKVEIGRREGEGREFSKRDNEPAKTSSSSGSRSREERKEYGREESSTHEIIN